MGHPGQRAENARQAAFQTTRSRRVPAKDADQAHQIVTGPVPADIRFCRAQAAAENQMAIEPRITDLDRGGQRVLARASEFPTLAAVVHRHAALDQALQPVPHQAARNAADQTRVRRGPLGGVVRSVRHGCWASAP